jgi:pSer/pThr/pTyr-binding forkhead associated (FHA) protein
MARLILTLDGQVLAEYNMNKERYTVGRLPDNDIRIDNPAVSGHHSLIINILNDSFLEDLNSTNGTYVNGKLIKKHALQHGDVITCGHHQLRFVEELTQPEIAERIGLPVVIRPAYILGGRGTGIAAPLAEWLGAPDGEARAAEILALTAGVVIYRIMLPLQPFAGRLEVALAMVLELPDLHALTRARIEPRGLDLFSTQLAESDLQLAARGRVGVIGRGGGRGGRRPGRARPVRRAPARRGADGHPHAPAGRRRGHATPAGALARRARDHPDDLR